MRLAPILLGLGVLACSSVRAKRAPSDGVLQVQWTDSSGTAALSAPAEARWCPRDTMLELIAVRNDSAIGVALYARDSLRAEGYPVFQSGLFAPWRPQATAAVRLITPLVLLGFESAWGRVVVTEGGSQRVSGTLDVHFKLAAGPDSLHLTGSFTRVAVRPADASCGRANKPRPG